MTLSSDFLPTETVPVVRLNPETHQRELVHLRWGLIPSWAKDPTIGGRMIYARAETVTTKRSFRDSFRPRRCLVVVDSFRLRRRAIQMRDGRPFGMGGVWERWQGDQQIQSCAVITTTANALVEPFNDRMPVIIAEEDYAHWLDPGFQDAEELDRMMLPCSADSMMVVPA
jgi:putative SOS response-associated peptidase YedK